MFSTSVPFAGFAIAYNVSSLFGGTAPAFGSGLIAATSNELMPDCLRHAGLIISGEKVIATGAALTHYTFVAHYGVVHNLKKFSPIFMVRTNAPGVKIICRGSYEYISGATGSPFDNPLSSRMDENDSILIFDNVLIPWEDV